MITTMLLLASLNVARTRPMQPPTPLPVPNSVLWIGAHPDDESLSAPLLAMWCREQGVRCTFFIATRGDNPPVRSGEAGAGSDYFHADLILLSLPDGGGSVSPRWPPLAPTLAAYIEAVHPDLILTFDPRHGTTCHPDHRAIGAAVLEATPLLSYRPAVWLPETQLTITMQPLTIHFDSATNAPSASMRRNAGRRSRTTCNAIRASSTRAGSPRSRMFPPTSARCTSHQQAP